MPGATAEPSSVSSALKCFSSLFDQAYSDRYFHGMQEKHRKQVKHYHKAGDFHELTFSCYRRLPLLTDDLCRMDLAEAIDRSMSRHRFALVAYVFMPEHVHLLVTPLTSDVNIVRLLADIKRPASLAVKRRLTETGSDLIQKLTVRQRPGVMTFRFWQEGPGYDRNLNQAKTIKSAIEYIHLNPVRRGLCERSIDWKWSSARVLLENMPQSSPPTVHQVDIDAGLICSQ